MTIRRVEIQRAGDIVEVAERKELDTMLTLMSLREMSAENQAEIDEALL